MQATTSGFPKTCSEPSIAVCKVNPTTHCYWLILHVRAVRQKVHLTFTASLFELSDLMGPRRATLQTWSWLCATINARRSPAHHPPPTLPKLQTRDFGTRLQQYYSTAVDALLSLIVTSPSVKLASRRLDRICHPLTTLRPDDWRPPSYTSAVHQAVLLLAAAWRVDSVKMRFNVSVITSFCHHNFRRTLT